MDQQTSLYDRFIGRPRSPLLIWCIVLVLFLLPLAVGYVEVGPGALIARGAWRALLQPPVVIAYILLVAPRMARVGVEVLRSFRPVVLLDDEQYHRLIQDVSRVDPRHEALAIGAGAVVGIVLGTRSNLGPPSPLVVVWLMSTASMYGLLLWTIQGSVAGTRVTTAILRQPLKVDIFEPSPFYAIGRQSLVAALVFVGGISLALLFSMTERSVLLRLEFWLVFLPELAVPVGIFFMAMTPTHRVLAAAKAAEQQGVQQHLRRALRQLMERLDAHQDTAAVTAEVNALTAYDQRLQQAGTWPYNTSMLQTLVFSVFIPAATIIGKVVVDVFFD
jgi:hypothetical protein